MTKEILKGFDGKIIPESDLDNLEKDLIGNYDIIDTRRYRTCDSLGITIFLIITFTDKSEIFISSIIPKENIYAKISIFL